MRDYVLYFLYKTESWCVMASPLGKAKSLKFKKDGTFRIMQIADTQDTNITSKNTVEFIGKALDSENPDLVVFTGDQIKGYGLSFATGNRDKKVAEAIRNIVTPVAERNIPFTFVFVFGNIRGRNQSAQGRKSNAYIR